MTTDRLDAVLERLDEVLERADDAELRQDVREVQQLVIGAKADLEAEPAGDTMSPRDGGPADQD